MSDPVTTIEEPTAPTKAPRKQKRKVKRRTAKVLAFKAPDEFAGMTERECCDACKPDCCVISNTNVCAHPFKTGMQAHMTNDKKALERYQRAKKALAHRRIEVRGG